MNNMTVLDEILTWKKKEVEERRELYPVKLLEKKIHFAAPTVSLKKYLKREDKCGIIAEIKRKSPSKGVINKFVSIERTSIGYMQAGASALSVLTDEKYFGGSSQDLQAARKFNFCPILRKDFIIDEYQVIESKSIGADAILLIAAALDPGTVKKLAALARSLGLEVLLEVHSRQELENFISDSVDLVGVNNRDLKTLEVNIGLSRQLGPLIPEPFIKVAESGISKPATVLELKSYGFRGFLVGEHFMSNSRPEKACSEFIQELNRLGGKEPK